MPDQPRPSARIVAEPRWDVYYEPRATIYLAGLVVLFAIAQSQAANAWFLAFGLLPMCFHVTTARRALAFVVIINVIAAGLDVWRDPGLPGALTALGILAFAVTFAYVYSRWMARVIEQSLERAVLIEQLEATRAELAAAHHEAGVQAERHRLAGGSMTPWPRGSPASSPCSRPARPASTPPAPPVATSTWRCSPRARTWPRPGPWSPRSPRPRWRRARSATPCAG
jgi:signal transduction histidine kinase